MLKVSVVEASENHSNKASQWVRIAKQTDLLLGRLTTSPKGGGTTGVVPMPKRKGLSNKIRFEVFKRDSFKCQYCGRSAPDVMLQVDHINPVARGGKNAMTNLVTSCQPCNGGKGATPLNDQSEVIKQKSYLDELNERRAQLTMMMQWREGLDGINDEAFNRVESDILSRLKCRLSHTGTKLIKAAIRKHGLASILESIRICEEQYLEIGHDGKPTPESITKAINYIPRIAFWSKERENGPNIDRILYARGVLRNTCRSLPYGVIDFIKDYISRGVDVETVIRIAKGSRNWHQFTDRVEEVLDAS